MKVVKQASDEAGKKIRENLDKLLAGKLPSKKKINKEQNNSKEFSERHKEILKDPELFQKMVGAELNKRLVGELEGRKVLLLCAYGGRLIENSQIASFNIMINDEAGIGKDYIAQACLEMLPQQYYIKKTRISPTVLNYWHNSKDEPQWTWNNKVLYLEDISESILNHEVFKIMCSNGSSAAIIKDQKIIELDVIGKPVMIVTTASAIPNPELVRRFVILNLDSTKKQTKEIMKRHSEFRQEGIIPMIDSKYKDAMQFLKRVKVMIPFASKIYNHFPDNHIIMRTHYPRFLDFISASAGFHQYQRKEKNGFIVAEEKDYELARECFTKLCSNQYMIPLTINQRKMLEIFNKNENETFSASQFHSKHNFISLKAVITNLGILTKYGLLNSDIGKDSLNRDLEIYYLSSSYNSNQKVNIPSYKDIMQNEESK